MGNECSQVCGYDNKFRPQYVEDIDELFEVLEVLGTGASAVVNRVKEKESKSQYACKFINKDFENALDLFMQEVEFLSKLDHPNILKLKAYYVSPQKFIIITYMCQGPAFFDFIIQQFQKSGVCSEAYVQKATRNMLGALAFLESVNIAHRDIKPENIMCRTSDAESEIVLIDFGTAIEVDLNTKYEGIVGTISYLAPEYLQEDFSGWEIIAADVWAVGVILFVLVSACHPFQCDQDIATIRKIRKTEIPWDKCKCSSSCTKFVQRLLNRNAKLRYAAAEALNDPWLVTDTEHQIDDVVDTLLQLVLQKRIRIILSILVKITDGISLARCENIFEALDENGDGGVDVGELKLFLTQLGASETRAMRMSQELMEVIDHDASGDVNKEEFETEYAMFMLSTSEELAHKTFGALLELVEKRFHHSDDRLDILHLASLLDMHATDLLKIFQYFDDFDGTSISKELFQKSVSFSTDEKSLQFFNLMTQAQKARMLGNCPHLDEEIDEETHRAAELVEYQMSIFMEGDKDSSIFCSSSDGSGSSDSSEGHQPLMDCIDSSKQRTLHEAPSELHEACDE